MEDDYSCRRTGSIPFKWEVCPGTPKHTRSASAAAAAASAKVSPAKLTPPPSMSSLPSPYYCHHSSSPRVVSSARSASVSPSRRRPYACGGHRSAPTAFFDATPRAAATEFAGTGSSEAETAAPAAASGCFSLPMLRRKGNKKGGGGSRSSAGPSSSSSVGSFSWDGELGLGLRRSASISSASSSLPLPPGRRRYADSRAEVDAATGRGWFF